MAAIAVIMLFVVAFVVVGVVAAQRMRKPPNADVPPAPAPAPPTSSPQLPNPGLKAETYLRRAEDKRSALRLYRTYDFE